MTTFADQAHFNNYDPSSFGWRIEPDLVPFTFKGVNFGRCARAVLPVFTALLTELEPLIPGGIAFGPHDDWAYSATDELPDGSPSFHHYGIAFDLNWRENPMGNYTNNPDAGQQGAIPYAQAVAIARKYGCEYGGSWSGGANRLGFKDYMHFECHLSPAVARTVQAPTIDPLGADVSNLSPEVHAEIKQIVADQFARYFPGQDGHQHVLETLVKEANAPIAADVAKLKADVAAIKTAVKA